MLWGLQMRIPRQLSERTVAGGSPQIAGLRLEGRYTPWSLTPKLDRESLTEAGLCYLGTWTQGSKGWRHQRQLATQAWRSTRKGDTRVASWLFSDQGHQANFHVSLTILISETDSLSYTARKGWVILGP